MLAIVLFLSSIASAATLYVDGALGTNGNGDPSTPFNNLQSALTSPSLQDGDTIIIAQGTYKPTTGTTRSISFEIVSKDVSLRGGYINNSGTWTHSGDPTLTILSGEINTSSATDNSYNVLKLSYSSATNSGTLIEYLTVTGGYANGSTLEQRTGGGIRITNGAPRLNKVIVSNNSAAAFGGGIYVFGAKPAITLCTIESNTTNNDQACGEGGGIYIAGTTSSGKAQLIDCKIQNNGAYNGNPGPYQGAGIEVSYSTSSNPTRVDIVNCLISGNRGNFQEGGACPAGSEGGGILIRPLWPGVVLNIINCTIVDNHASTGGGIYMHNLPNCPNPQDPGCNPTTNFLVRVRNSIVWNNQASSNAGHEIFQKNTSGHPGGRFWTDYCNIRHFDITPTYVAGSILEPLTPDTNIGDDVDSSDQGPDNPLFVNSVSDWHLQYGSPSINTGNPTDSIIPADEFDLDGNSYTTERTPDLDLARRVVGNVDMGAYEKQPNVTCPPDVAPVPFRNGLVNVVDLLYVINSWGTCPAQPAPCYADINGDGVVNVVDMLAVINGWGPCAGYSGDAGSPPEDVTDCMTICDGETDFEGCVAKCLCGLGWNTCDE